MARRSNRAKCPKLPRRANLPPLLPLQLRLNGVVGSLSKAAPQLQVPITFHAHCGVSLPLSCCECKAPPLTVRSILAFFLTSGTGATGRKRGGRFAFFQTATKSDEMEQEQGQ